VRRHIAWLVLPVVALGSAALAVPSGAAPADRTAPYGPFGFTTVGLGAGHAYGEPSLAMAPDGKHYAVSTPTGGDDNATVDIWHSSDRGDTWAFSKFSSDSGGGDSELDFRPDGTLLAADLELGTNQDSEIHRSTDFGKTWNAMGSAAGPEQDRQWFAHTPDGKRQFLVYHDLTLEGEFFVESGDGGKTWDPVPHIVNDPSQVPQAPGFAFAPTEGSTAPLIDEGINTFSGPMLIDNNAKDFYVVYSISNTESNLSPNGGGIPPFGAVRGIVVAHSKDAGATWTNKYAVVAKPNPSDPSKEDSVGTMFPWGFLDQAGTVYVVFGSTKDNGGGTDHYGFYYVYSTDKGAHWSKAKRIDGLPEGKGSIVFNTGAAVSPGVIDVAWLQKDTSAIGTESGVWHPWFAQITDADSGHPQITRQRVTTVPNHRDGVCILGTICLLPAPVNQGSDDRSLLDFMELSVNPKTHMAGIVFADNGKFAPRSGPEVVYAAQTVQPKTAPGRGGSGGDAGANGGTGNGGVGSDGSPLPDSGGSATLPVVGVGVLLAALGLAAWRRRTGVHSR
jgi:hypothetical protein